MFNLDGIFSMMCALFFLGVGLVFLILKLLGLLLLGWWSVIVCAILVCIFLALGAAGIG